MLALRRMEGEVRTPQHPAAPLQNPAAPLKQSAAPLQQGDVGQQQALSDKGHYCKDALQWFDTAVLTATKC